MKIKKNPKVLVGVPTFDGKEYVLKRFVDRVNELTYPHDFVMIDNSKTNKYFNNYQYYKTLSILNL